MHRRSTWNRGCARCSPGWKRLGDDETFAVVASAVRGARPGGRRARRKRSAGSSRHADADKFLFQRGEEEFKERELAAAREYYRQIVDNYPQSPYRPDAKLAVGDTYIGEDTTESLLLAVNEFREFLTFYPTNPRADYAQYRLAYAYHEQMLAPERDQTPRATSIKELQVFLDRYPNSALTARGAEADARGQGSA